MNPIRRLILRCRATLWTAFSLVCITAALLVGIANLLLPYADRYRPQVAAWLSERIGRPVSIDALDAQWAAFGPRVQLHGLMVGDAGDPDRLHVDLAAVSFDVLGWLMPGGHGTRSLRVAVDEVEIVRRLDGSWGLGSDETGPGQVRTVGNPLRWLRGQTVTGLEARRVIVRDARSGVTAKLPGGQVNVSSTDDRLRLSGRLGSRAGGLVEVAIDHDPTAATTQLYAAGRELDLATWGAGMFRELAIADGEGSFRLWADLQAMTLRGEVSLADVRLEATGDSPVQGTFKFRSAAAEISGWSQPADTGLLLANVRFERGTRTWMAETVGMARQDGRLRLNARGLPLGDVAEAAVLIPALPEAWRRRLAMAALDGTAQDVDIAVMRDAEGIRLDGHADVRELRWEAVDRLPGLSAAGLDLRLTGQRAEGRVTIDGGHLALPRLFRNPFEPVQLGAAFALAWDGPTPRLEFEADEVRNAGVGAVSRGAIEFNGGRPLVELSVIVTEGQVAVAHRYWPVSIMPPAAVAWLDRALVGGRLESGQVLLSGDLDDWPFDGGEGRFTARATVADAQLDFLPGWPSVDAIQADLEFDPFGMAARVRSADLAGMAIGESDVDLPRFREPILDIAAQGRTRGDAALAFLGGLPLDIPFRQYLSGLVVDGESDAWVKLEIPLARRLGTTSVTGHAWLDGARVYDAKWSVAFEQATGRVDFTHAGIEARDLDLSYRGERAKLSLYTGQFVDEPGIAAVGTLSATSSLGLLVDDLAAFEPLLPHLTGSAPWQARVVVPRGGGAPNFELTGTLRGTDVTLPAPMAAAGELPVRLSFNLGSPLQRLDARLGTVGALRARRDGEDEPWRAALAFGTASAPEPDTVGLTITGTIPEFDLDAWMGLFGELADPGKLPASEAATLNRIDLAIRHMRMAGRDFDAMQIRATRDRDWWNVSIEGEAVLGRFRLPSTFTENRLVLAEFEKLYWPRNEADDEGLADDDEGAPIETDFDPRVLPPIDFFAADFRFGGSPLGTVRFESHPTSSGMRIDSFSTDAPHLRVVADGDWFATGQSEFVATVTAPSLGNTLEEFGFRGVIDGGQLLAQLDASWQGSPADFELARLNGSLELSIGQGSISEVEPGAGRIFGLLSVQALPRRLVLDFSDLFDSGLSFDSITGDFALENGVAHTGDLIVEGPTADVLIQGRTGLADRDYDQVITVVPKVGGALPLVGALAGGGVGAAAFLVLQGVLGDQIDQITRYHYAVTGPWSSPAVETLGADDARIDRLRLEAGS